MKKKKKKKIKSKKKTSFDERWRGANFILQPGEKFPTKGVKPPKRVMPPKPPKRIKIQGRTQYA